MKSAKISWVVVFVAVVSVAAWSHVGLAQGTDGKSDRAIGTWKLNLAKSKYSPGPTPKSATVRKIEPWQGGLKAIADGVDAQGKPTHTEITYKYDGKDYPLKGAASNTTRAYKRIDDHTMEFVTKADGKVTTTTRIVFSPDGKVETGTATGKDAQGRTVNNVSVWDRQ